jgi:hypothetical protein
MIFVDRLSTKIRKGFKFWKPLTNEPFKEVVVTGVDQFAVFDDQFKLVKKNK